MNRVDSRHPNRAANLRAEGPNSCLLLMARVAGLALLIIGCVGAAGVFPGSSIGWVALGLGGGTFALSLAAGDLKNRKFSLVVQGFSAVTLIVIGALGGGGILSASQVAWGIIGNTLPCLLLRSMNYCYQSLRQAHQKEARAAKQIRSLQNGLAALESSNTAIAQAIAALTPVEQS